MKNKKVFFWLLALVVVICAFSILAFLVNPGKIIQNDLFLTDSPNKAETLSINHFRPVMGTSFFIASVEQEREWRPNISARWFSFDERYSVRNLVFLDGNTLSSHYLFDTNEKYVVGIYQFPDLNSYFKDAEQKEVKWLVYKIVHGDTNSDGVVNSKDSFSLAMSSVNGKNYVELIENIDTVRGMDLLEEHYLVVIYKTDGEYFASKIDLNQKIVLEIRKLENIPSEKDYEVE
jgi:hypothetical protein